MGGPSRQGIWMTFSSKRDLLENLVTIFGGIMGCDKRMTTRRESCFSFKIQLLEIWENQLIFKSNQKPRADIVISQTSKISFFKRIRFLKLTFQSWCQAVHPTVSWNTLSFLHTGLKFTQISQKICPFLNELKKAMFRLVDEWRN